MRNKNKMSLFAIVLAFTIAIFSITVCAAENSGPLLLDDYNRASLGVEGNGGAYNTPNSKGITIYWIQWANAAPKIENNALKLQMDAKGWFGEGGMIKDAAYKYIVIKVKGEKGGEEKTLSLNPDAKGLVKYTDLKGADGKSLPGITKDYQNIVIDIEKSGFKLPGGFEALHFNNTDPITLYIDEIYLSKDGTVSQDTAASGDKTSTEQPSANNTNDNQAPAAQTSSDKTDSNQTTKDESKSQATNSQPQAVTTSEGSSNKGLLIGIIAVATAAAIGGVVYVLYIRKPN